MKGSIITNFKSSITNTSVLSFLIQILLFPPEYVISMLSSKARHPSSRYTLNVQGGEARTCMCALHFPEEFETTGKGDYIYASASGLSCWMKTEYNKIKNLIRVLMTFVSVCRLQRPTYSWIDY